MRYATATLLVAAAIVAAYLVYETASKRWELLADFAGLAAASMAVLSAHILAPLRSKASAQATRIPALLLSAISLFVSICLLLEFGIGLVWYSLDKIVRHFQHS